MNRILSDSIIIGSFSVGTESTTFYVSNNGNVGVGLTDPDTKLHIYDVAGLGAFKLEDGSQNQNYILSSDSTGLASWTSPTSSSVLGYKKYVALISQFGTASPTAVVLENTLSGEPVYSRTALGEYYITLNGEFTTNKTAILFQNAIRTFPNMMFIAAITRISDDQIVIYTKNSSGTSVEDGIIEEQTLEIRVYV